MPFHNNLFCYHFFFFFSFQLTQRRRCLSFKARYCGWNRNLEKPRRLDEKWPSSLSAVLKYSGVFPTRNKFTPEGFLSSVTYILPITIITDSFPVHNEMQKRAYVVILSYICTDILVLKPKYNQLWPTVYLH